MVRRPARRADPHSTAIRHTRIGPCVCRLDGGVARYGLHTTLPRRDDELLQQRFREGRHVGADGFLQGLERGLLPLDVLGVTFFR